MGWGQMHPGTNPTSEASPLARDAPGEFCLILLLSLPFTTGPPLQYFALLMVYLFYLFYLVCTDFFSEPLQYLLDSCWRLHKYNSPVM